MLHLIDMALPGWSIQLTGKATEPDGHWRCSLRETRGSDEIEIVGLGDRPGGRAGACSRHFLTWRCKSFNAEDSIRALQRSSTYGGLQPPCPAPVTQLSPFGVVMGAFRIKLVYYPH